jgi:hypothetical protein
MPKYAEEDVFYCPKSVVPRPMFLERNRNRGRSDRRDNEGMSSLGSITHELCNKSAYRRLWRLSSFHCFCCFPLSITSSAILVEVDAAPFLLPACSWI